MQWSEYSHLRRVYENEKGPKEYQKKGYKKVFTFKEAAREEAGKNRRKSVGSLAQKCPRAAY
jgi:hypothetical protein